MIRYAKSGLKETDITDLHQRLTILMDEKALYKQNDITLADLAAILDTHPNYLSQVINEREQKNFYNYINTLLEGSFSCLCASGKAALFIPRPCVLNVDSIPNPRLINISRRIQGSLLRVVTH
ncbi:MAG: hypothetical protein IPL92_18060 [Saprospiraceae bacterium]|nr:hypothetical protein [Candidatus Opimibacter iunctus]